MADAELYDIECRACPSGGSCSGMFTANSMNVLCEAMGIALPGNGTILALTPEREALVRRAARRAVEIAGDERFRLRRIIDADAIHNAMVVDMAMGGSSNTVLHMLAIAREAGRRLRPEGRRGDRGQGGAHREDRAVALDRAHGGHPPRRRRPGGAARGGAARRRSSARTRSPSRGETVGERIRGAEIADRSVIHPLEKAYSPGGRPRGAVREPRARGRGGEDRRDPALDAQVHRPARSASTRRTTRSPGSWPAR